MNDSEFRQWRSQLIISNYANQRLATREKEWTEIAVENQINYTFEWLGTPVIQFPLDLVLIQEAIFKCKPDKIIEVGIARGGLTLFLASMLHLVNAKRDFGVIGVDQLISDHTKKAIEDSIFRDSICLIEGDSTNFGTIRKLKQLTKEEDRIMVVLDSHHTETHVFRELELYSEIVTKGCYLIVLDTLIEFLPKATGISERPWGPGNSPFSGLEKFEKYNPDKFIHDEEIEMRGINSSAPFGYLIKR
jgi:cephalosporin hydroxylase